MPGDRSPETPFTASLRWGPYPPSGDPARVRQALIKCHNGFRIWIVTGTMVRRASDDTYELVVVHPNRRVVRHEEFCSDSKVAEIVRETRALRKPRVRKKAA